MESVEEWDQKKKFYTKFKSKLQTEKRGVEVMAYY